MSINMYREGNPQNIYNIVIFFEDTEKYEREWAMSTIHNLMKVAEVIEVYPGDIEDAEAAKTIKEDGIRIKLSTFYTIDQLRLFLQIGKQA